MKYTLVLLDVKSKKEVALTKPINWNAMVESKSQAKGFEFNGNKLSIKLCPQRKGNHSQWANEIINSFNINANQ